MTQELSSLMDGELEAHEANGAISSCLRNESMKQKWQAYHVIGDALRGECPCRNAATQRIMAALEDEPTVLAPRRLPSMSAGRIAFAAAASVATVAVVAWIGMQGNGAPSGPAMAGTAPARLADAQMAVPPGNVVPLNNVNEYLVAHRQLPNADFYRPASNQAAAAR